MGQGQGHGNAYGQTMHSPDGAFSHLIEGPQSPAVSLADIKAHVVADDFNDDDALLQDYVDAATGIFDAAGNGYLGRAIITQRWSLVLGGFPASGHFDLPVPVAQQVVSITYYDASNVEQTLSADAYRLTINGDFASIDLVEGQSWPATYTRADAVAVLYDAGYGDTDADVPAPLKRSIAILAAALYNNRIEMGHIPPGVRQMVAGYRVSRGYF